MNFKLSTVVFIDFYHNFVLWLYRFEILKQIDVVFDSQKLWPFWYWYFVASFAMLNSSNNKRICFDIFPMYKKFNKFSRFIMKRYGMKTTSKQVKRKLLYYSVL